MAPRNFHVPPIHVYLGHAQDGPAPGKCPTALSLP
jgi:hypothetical protein